jgi:DNA polymerase elongation subunit (family B)
MLNGDFYTDVSRKGNLILYRGYDADGHKIYNKFKYRPQMFLPTKDGQPSVSGWKSMTGIELEPQRFDSMSDHRAFMKTYEGIASFEIFGNDRHIPAFIQSQFPGDIVPDKRLIDVLKLDIEVARGDGYSEACDAANQIVSIVVQSSRDGINRIWGLEDYDISKSISPNIPKEFTKFDSEEEMLEDFVRWWSEPMNTPDIITGWNTEFYDIPYLINRVVRLHGMQMAQKFSPWEMVNERQTNVKGQEKFSFEIVGIQHLDYYALFRKFCSHTYGEQESYKLDFIANLVLGDNKLDYSDYGSLDDLYEQNYELFIDYNVKDVVIVGALEAKLGLINLAHSMAYMAGVNYADTLGTTAIWDAIIFRKLASQKIAVSQPRRQTSSEYVGGYVKPPQVGLHEWVVGFDVNSLYPNIIVQYNMSPETIVKHSKMDVTPESLLENPSVTIEPNLAMAASGAVFRRDKQGVIAGIVEEYYNRRVTIKADMIAQKRKLELETDPSVRFMIESNVARLETEQTSVKILMNSLYGAMGNQYFRYFDLDVAIAITTTGQYIIHRAERAVNELISVWLQSPKDRVIAMDTDSIYVACADVIDHFKPVDPTNFLDEFAKKILEPELARTFKFIATETNAYKNTMVMKREAIASRGIWLAKKRYVLNILNNEGVQYAKPKIKMTGIQAIQSSTPAICRQAFKDMFHIIMNNSEADCQVAIGKFRDQFEIAAPEKIAFPRGVQNLNKYADAKSIYAKGKGVSTPIHCRAALLYNRKLKDHGLQKSHRPISSGDKIKFMYLKLPNPIGENVIAFVDTLPTEFGLDAYIDRDLQFEKTFLAPLDKILFEIKWNSIPCSNLEAFFS